MKKYKSSSVSEWVRGLVPFAIYARWDEISRYIRVGEEYNCILYLYYSSYGSDLVCRVQCIIKIIMFCVRVCMVFTPHTEFAVHRVHSLLSTEYSMYSVLYCHPAIVWMGHVHSLSVVYLTRCCHSRMSMGRRISPFVGPMYRMSGVRPSVHRMSWMKGCRCKCRTKEAKRKRKEYGSTYCFCWDSDRGWTWGVRRIVGADPQYIYIQSGRTA